MGNQLIGLTGYAGVGKTTTANVLVEEHDFMKMSFAHPIKLMVMELLSYAGKDHIECLEMVYGNQKEVPSDALCGHTPRFAMQTLGTEWGRHIMAGDFWINVTKGAVQKYLAYNDNVVLDDIRFQNEIDMIHDLGGKVIQIKQTGMNQGSTHASEDQSILTGIDGHIWNDGPIEMLSERVAGQIEKFYRLPQ